jgi:hypothetical protein
MTPDELFQAVRLAGNMKVSQLQTVCSRLGLAKR